MSETLLAAVRALRVADPDLGLKPLLAKLREQQPDLGAATREVREALIALKAEESEAAKAAASLPATNVVPPAANNTRRPSQPTHPGWASLDWEEERGLRVACAVECLVQLPAQSVQGEEMHSFWGIVEDEVV